MSPNVVLFSGGRTSGYMLRRLMESHLGEMRHPSACDYEWIVIFCNTGKERDETLDFVHEVEVRWKVPVVWLEYTRVPASKIRPGIFPTNRRNLNLSKAAENGEETHWFKRVNYDTASRNGEPFDDLIRWASVLPNPTSRICSVQLKMRTAMRFLFSMGFKNYRPHIGIRTDESHRATEILSSCDSFEDPKFPLIDMGISEVEVRKFWSLQDFDLKLQSYEGNCDLCFLKAKHKRLRIIRESPDRADWWIAKESEKSASCKDGAMFRKSQPYSLLRDIALGPVQSELFEATDRDIPCSCAERSFDCSIPD